MSIPLKVKGIRPSKYKSGEFATLLLYSSGKNNTKQLAYTFLICEIYLVKALRANLLIGNNIMSLEDFVIDIKENSVFIESCRVTVPINARQRRHFLMKKLLVC